jgi:hypothetical protein
MKKRASASGGCWKLQASVSTSHVSKPEAGHYDLSLALLQPSSAGGYVAAASWPTLLRVRVLGAVRLSKMRDESTSPERQRGQVEAWAQLHDHAVTAITEDTDVSGKVPATLRPGLGP